MWQHLSPPHTWVKGKGAMRALLMGHDSTDTKDTQDTTRSSHWAYSASSRVCSRHPGRLQACQQLRSWQTAVYSCVLCVGVSQRDVEILGTWHTDGLMPIREGQDWPKPPGFPQFTRATLLQHVMTKGGMLPS